MSLEGEHDVDGVGVDRFPSFKSGCGNLRKLYRFLLSHPAHSFSTVNSCARAQGAGNPQFYSARTYITRPVHTSLHAKVIETMGIADLPSELLVEVFVAAVQGEPLVPLRLRSICSWWKDVVDNAPRIWQHLVLNDDVAVSQARTVLWTKKSLPLPIDIDLKITDSDMILVHLAPLFASVERWRRLTLLGARELHLTDVNLSPSSLQTLSIDLYDSELVDGIDQLSLTEPHSMFIPCSSRPQTYSINLKISRLPEPRLLTPLRFTHLNLSEANFGTNLAHPLSVLSFLTMFPALQSFTFTGWPQDDGAYDTVFPLVNLSDLHTLHLRNTCSARAILSHIDAPRLRVLYLNYLNVEFQLLGANTTLSEPGDSDDEANDFSQSPWSDHATGMGLRTLIARCNPPIRVLEMDFSDMRTKDFVFVFDRLDALQEFMIVASDMSDKVINLLKPYRRKSKDEGPGEWAIRLPRLKRFELFNCQRLSGKAIVDALGARVAYTDQHTPDDTLLEVSVTNCDGFESHHGHALSEILGRRLRLEFQD